MDGLLDHVLSVDAVRKYKTHAAAYTIGTEATGLEADRILFVSSNSWDALAATWFGYRTLWVNRQQLPFEELGTQPTKRLAAMSKGLRHAVECRTGSHLECPTFQRLLRAAAAGAVPPVSTQPARPTSGTTRTTRPRGSGVRTQPV